MIEEVRDHLAVHDRQLVFLFGAGTSSAINIAPPAATGEKQVHTPLIPGIDGLTEISAHAVAGIGKNHGEAWKLMVKQCSRTNPVVNVEHILSLVRTKLEAIGKGEELAGLDHTELGRIERTICTSIAAAANPAEVDIPSHTPHADFAAWVKKVNRTAPLEIFTTNYDILVERAFEAMRVPLFDGFVGAHNPFFYPECVDDDSLLPESRWVRLWKLHGSVNWNLDSGSSDRRIVRTRPSSAGEMILPSHEKYSESRKRPYITFMDRLGRLMNSEHALLITAGYSFRDDHINAILYGALENRSTANIISLQFDELDETDPLVVEATRRSNLMVVAPNGGVRSGAWGDWQLTQPVDAKTCSFMDIGFDSNAHPDEAESPPAVSEDLRGRVRLGDFNWFGRFLEAMGV